MEKFRDDVRTRPGLSGSAAVHVGGNELSGVSSLSLPHGSNNTTCTDNWTAANTTSRETVDMFEQTGVFVSACRHGFVQTLVEMRHSGELLSP